MLTKLPGVAAAAALLLACNRQVAGGSTDGAKVYEGACASCHGAAGKPSVSMASSLNVRDLTDPAFRARVTPALVELQVRKGSSNKIMPGFEGTLSDAQISSVVAFIVAGNFAAATP
ncbi:MAG TPA: cytochrome c [Kofleriaceae bacterium]|nr:cytochrome c [Kofleriaceae bacterium]